MRRFDQIISLVPAGALIEACLAAALLTLAVAGFKSLRLDRLAVESWRAARAGSENFRAVNREVIPSLGGVTADGHAVLLSLPPNKSRYIAFVVHAASLKDDLSTWASVGRLFGAGSPTELVGYCNGLACVRALRAGVAAPSFPVIGYGEYVTDRVLLSADAGHRALVLDSNLRNLGSVPWTSASPPAMIAAAIVKLK